VKAKKKICFSCKKESLIWKSVGREKYCKSCWSCQKSGKELQTKKPIRPRSPKREIEDALYTKLRKLFLDKYPMCKANLPGCTLNATDVHHKKGRTGDNYVKESTWLPVCRVCHMYIHDKLSMDDAVTLNLRER